MGGLLAAPRIAAVDYGPRRVGLALSDGLRLTAQPVGTFTPEAALDRLRALDAEHGLALVVLGWPLDPDTDAEGPAVARVRPYLGRLRRAFPHVTVVPFDERDTSKEAAAALYASGQWKAARRDKGRLDAAAACVLLARFLDEEAPAR